jgi:hypothetical protein
MAERKLKAIRFVFFTKNSYGDKAIYNIVEFKTKYVIGKSGKHIVRFTNEMLTRYLVDPEVTYVEIDKIWDKDYDTIDKCVYAILDEWENLEFDDEDDNDNRKFFEAIVRLHAKKFNIDANEIFEDERIKCPTGQPS